ncbi:hypothetical protein EMIT0P74_30407 [Pseudomonas sp. IT-P74]
MFSRGTVTLENQGIRLAGGGHWPISDPDQCRQLIDEWCEVRSANFRVVNLLAIHGLTEPPASQRLLKSADDLRGNPVTAVPYFKLHLWRSIDATQRHRILALDQYPLTLSDL